MHVDVVGTWVVLLCNFQTWQKQNKTKQNKKQIFLDLSKFRNNLTVCFLSGAENELVSGSTDKLVIVWKKTASQDCTVSYMFIINICAKLSGQDKTQVWLPVVSSAAVFWDVTQRSPPKKRLLTSEQHSFHKISQPPLPFHFQECFSPNLPFETCPIRECFLSLYPVVGDVTYECTDFRLLFMDAEK